MSARCRSTTWFMIGVEVSVVVRRAHVDDVGAGCHRVHGLDVEGLLAAPALRVLARVLRTVVGARGAPPGGSAPVIGAAGRALRVRVDVADSIVGEA